MQTHAHRHARTHARAHTHTAPREASVLSAAPLSHRTITLMTKQVTREMESELPSSAAIPRSSTCLVHRIKLWVTHASRARRTKQWRWIWYRFVSIA